MTTAIIPGSIQSVAESTGKSIAETFVNAECVVLVDTSGSMDYHDSRGGLSRYTVACAELAALQNNIPGKIAVISFSDLAQFCPDGRPVFLMGGTNLTGALKFCKFADLPGMRFIIISDGEPNEERSALEEAAKFNNRFDCIFVGPEGGSGQDFLKRLATARGGKQMVAAQAKELAIVAQTLLLESGR